MPNSEQSTARSPLDWTQLKLFYREHKDGLRLEYGGEQAYVQKSAGADYLYELILHPYQSIRALDLLALQHPQQADNNLYYESVASLAAYGLYSRETYSTDFQMDAQGLKEIKQRLVWLNERCAELMMNNDCAALEELQEEREHLIEYLAAVLNPQGKAKALTNDQSLAAKAVCKAIRRAIAQIEKQIPALGSSLRSCLSLGSTLCFKPGLE